MLFAPLWYSALPGHYYSYQDQQVRFKVSSTMNTGLSLWSVWPFTLDVGLEEEIILWFCCARLPSPRLDLAFLLFRPRNIHGSGPHSLQRHYLSYEPHYTNQSSENPCRRKRFPSPEQLASPRADEPLTSQFQLWEIMPPPICCKAWRHWVWEGGVTLRSNGTDTRCLWQQKSCVFLCGFWHPIRRKQLIVFCDANVLGFLQVDISIYLFVCTDVLCCHFCLSVFLSADESGSVSFSWLDNQHGIFEAPCKRKDTLRR